MKTSTKPPDTIQYGFKRISRANLLEPDEHPAYPSRLRGEKWVQACLKPQLEPGVPKEIAFMFEVARSSMVYGQFFLPLASLAVEQGYRVLEAGARLRCQQLGLLPEKPGKSKTVPQIGFAELVNALHGDDKIASSDLDTWKAMVSLRNRFSHPTTQIIQRRHDTAESLADQASLLNRLFK